MTKPRRLSAGTVLVRETPDGPRFLVLRAYRNWDFPKGLVAAGEEPLEAALRETAEETGIEDVTLPWGPVYFETPPYAGGKVARYYLASTRSERVTLRPSPELGRPEHHEFRWVAADDARTLLGPRVRAVLDWAVRRMTEGEAAD